MYKYKDIGVIVRQQVQLLFTTIITLIQETKPQSFPSRNTLLIILLLPFIL